MVPFCYTDRYMKIKKPLWLIGSVVISQLAGALGALATTPNIDGWYSTLNKPFFNPPNWIFGPVWTTLYTMMGVALYLVLTAKKTDTKKTAITLFLVHLVVNSLWSIVFFGLQQPGFALIIITLLWLMIAKLIKLFNKLNVWAGRLLWPYLAWVSFASLLNLFIWRLN